MTSTIQRQVAGSSSSRTRALTSSGCASAGDALSHHPRQAADGARRALACSPRSSAARTSSAVHGRALERTLVGKGQFVLIVGEPGIGKSRLVEEFRGRMGERPHSWIEWSSSQLLQNTPLHPVLGWGRARLAVPKRRPGSGSRSSNCFSPRWGSTPAGSLRCLRRWSAFRSRPTACPADRGGDPPRPVGGHDRVGDGGRAEPAARAGLRGFAVVRPDLDRAGAGPERVRRAGADPGARDRAAGISPALGPEAAPQGHFACAPRRGAGSAHDRRARDPPRPVGERGAAGRRARRRRAAVRRGGDAVHSRARRAGGRAGDSGDAQAIAGGSPRPAGEGARGRADRRRPRAELPLPPSARRHVGRRAGAQAVDDG